MRLFATAGLLRTAAATIRVQKAHIRTQNLLIDMFKADKNAAELAYMRIGRDLIEQFLIALDTPENHDVIRARLSTALGFYRDEIAVKEEHVR